MSKLDDKILCLEENMLVSAAYLALLVIVQKQQNGDPDVVELNRSLEHIIHKVIIHANDKTQKNLPFR